MTSDLLTAREVAAMFRVDPKTVTRWAAAGRISAIRTPGGHRRYRTAEVLKLLEQGTTEAAEGPVCFKCRGTSRDGFPVIDRGRAYGDARYMHAYGKCLS